MNEKRIMNKALHEFLDDKGGEDFGCVYLKNPKQRDEFFEHFKERYPDTTFDGRHHNIFFPKLGKGVKFSTEGEGAKVGFTRIDIRTH